MSEYDDMSLDELKTKLDEIKKINFAAELDKETLKVTQREADKVVADRELMKEEVRAEVLKEAKGASKIVKTESDGKDDKWTTFSQKYSQKYGLKGLSYEDIAKDQYARTIGF